MERSDMRELDYGIGMAVQTLVEALGMFSENLQRIHLGDSIAYPEKAFTDLIERNGVCHNGVLLRWDK